MSFWPLETKLLDELRRAQTLGPVLELGAGEGDFARLLVSEGIRPVMLDHARVAKVPGLDAVRASAETLPLRAASVGGVVMANVLRHIPERARRVVREEIRRVTRPGACVVVLEDDPEATNEAEGNYREALRALSRFDPRRGELAGPEEGERFLRGIGPCTLQGSAVNRNVVREPLRPLDWMLARVEGRDEELDRLRTSVGEHGMEYGNFWYRVHAREAD